MKDILILNHEFPPLGGGASPVSYEIAKGYVKKGFSVDVVTMCYNNLPEFEILEGVRVFRINCLRKRKEDSEIYEMLSYVFSAISFLRNKLKEKKYDLCHCHFMVPSGVVALYLKKVFDIKYIVTIHGSDIPGYNTDRFKFGHYFTKPLLKLVSCNARNICSPSLFLKDLAERNIGHFNIMHIPNGIDLDAFHLDLTKPKENIILSTGRLVKRKGFHTIIRAVHDIELPYEVHIAGDGPFRQELETLAKGSKTKIVFHGWLEKGSKELMELYERASIYILVSLKENASISLLEGMAAKCAVISTNVSGCPETVGDAGLLIDFDDDKALKRILIDLCHNQSIIKQYSEKAYSRLVSNFLWHKIIAQYIDALN